MPKRTLIIDNFDSFTFNLYQYCIKVGSLPIVVRNNQLDWPTLRDNYLPFFDNIIISPGPGNPTVEADFGICSLVLQHADIPILGVCLGHQGLAAVYGAKIINVEPMHGQSSFITHTGSCGLFDGIPQTFSVVRYHSLAVDPETLPMHLIPTAWCGNVLMALKV